VSAIYWVWRRELAVLLRAPIAFVVGGLVLVVQGIAFAALVAALSDPQRPAPLGALLEGWLAGTLLTWVLALVVLTLLGMRAIAEDRRAGTWELLLTAQVGEGAAVVGKWLAASTVYALAWLPTLAYLGVIAVYRADTGTWDAGAIATGYAGAILLGAALLAWAIAASAATSSVLAAGGAGFGALVLLFLAGELPALWPQLPVAHPALADALAALSLRRLATAFARGDVSLADLVLLAGIAATGLAAAVALACAGRRRRSEVRARAAIAALVGLIGALALALAVRHPLHLDLSSSGANDLDAQTREIAASSPDATITIVQPTLDALDPVYDEATRVARRIADAAPHVRVVRVDPASVPGGLDEIVRASGLARGDLTGGGAIIVDAGGRRRVLDVFALAALARTGGSTGGAVTVERLAIEQALAGALAALSLPKPLTACWLDGDSTQWPLATARARAEGFEIVDIPDAHGAATDPSTCAVIVVMEGKQATPEIALDVQTYLRRGGALFAASNTVTGLEPILTSDGLGIADPPLVEDHTVSDGYSDQPINAGFANVRITQWPGAGHAVTAEFGAKPLVSTGDVPLAALGRSKRVVVCGDPAAFATDSASPLWFARALRFLARGPDVAPSVAATHPDPVRLILTPAQKQRVLVLCIGGIPLAWLVLGGALVWWRRRKQAP
jgi:ABC-2 type transport system permease protein